MYFTRAQKTAFPQATKLLAPLVVGLPVETAVLATSVIGEVTAQLSGIAGQYWVQSSDRPGLNVDTVRPAFEQIIRGDDDASLTGTLSKGQWPNTRYQNAAQIREALAKTGLSSAVSDKIIKGLAEQARSVLTEVIK